MFRICKGLSVDMPDVHTKAYVKDLSIMAEKLLESPVANPVQAAVAPVTLNVLLEPQLLMNDHPL